MEKRIKSTLKRTLALIMSIIGGDVAYMCPDRPHGHAPLSDSHPCKLKASEDLSVFIQYKHCYLKRQKQESDRLFAEKHDIYTLEKLLI